MFDNPTFFINISFIASIFLFNKKDLLCSKKIFIYIFPLVVFLYIYALHVTIKNIF